jgi:acyl-coenzyme A synthetase/AMP-(fatty) acid ligase
MNVRDLILNRIDQSGSQTFLIDGNSGRQITYTEFHRLACALAAELSARGLHRGGRVAVMFPNCCELAILYFAAMYVGAVIVPINPNLSENDIRFIVGSCNPKLVVASASCTEKVRGVQANICVTILSSQNALTGNQADGIVLEALVAPAGFVPLAGVTADDFLVIMFTSGTTAKPKGLVHRIGRMFRNATAFADMQGIDEASRFYLTLSMAYMGGFYNLLILPFLRGATVVVDNVFDARSSLNFWEKIQRHQVNTLWFAPTVMSILMKMDRGRTGEEYCRQSIRHVLVGFAPLPLKLKQDFELRYGVHLIENYGLSETLFVSARSGSTSNSGYVGEAVPGVQLRVVRDDGTTLPAHAEGELQVLTPDLMAGYLGDEGSVMELSAAEWFSTGDLARLDDHGSLFITGRKKDMIIRGGVNISPAAVEDVLLHAPGVADVAVVSVPHELYGEDVVAVLKLEAGLQLESILASVMAHATRELAAHQQPARYVAIDDFPRTANGKVQKTRLRELVFEKLQIGSEALLRSRPAPQRAAG